MAVSTVLGLSSNTESETLYCSRFKAAPVTIEN